MEILSREFHLFLVQADHLSGECVGQAISALYEAGAANVQVLTGITKKNRPSYVILIDCRPQHEEQVEQTIIRELQVGGWHKITTEHSFLRNEILPFEVAIKCDGVITPYTLQAKHFIGGGIRPEHDSVIKMRQCIQENYQVTVDYSTLYSFAAAAVADARKTLLDLDPLRAAI